MSGSSKGSVEASGRNVRARSGLNKSILGQGWFGFRRQLEYKTAWGGGFFVAVPAANTSRACPCCGHISADNRRTQSLFACVRCAHEANADHVGAINVPERGQRLLVCGEMVQSARSKKQEPAEVTQAIAA